MKIEEKYGMWINKTQARKIIGLLPFELLNVTEKYFPGRTYPLYYRDEVIAKSKALNDVDFTPEVFEAIEYKSPVRQKTDPFGILDN